MNLLFIRILKWVVNAVWYVLIPLMAIAAVAIAVNSWHMSYLLWDIPVDVKQPGILPALQSSGAASFVSVSAAAIMKIKVKLTPLVVTQVVVFYSVAMFLLFGTLYHLRKILNSLKAHTPFTEENIRRLRFISLFVFLMAVINFLDSICNTVLISSFFPEITNAYSLKINWGVVPVLISLVVFVLSEIFKQGYQLKTDNESFV